MRCRSVALGLLGCLVAHPAFAQVHSEKYASVGAVTPGDDPPRLHLSGGADRVFDRASFGADAGFVYFGRGGRSQDDGFLTIASVTGAFHPAPPTRRLQPFISAGPSLVGAYVGWHAGGGATYWWARRTGLRVDLRVIAPFSGEGGLVLARAGVAFRTLR